MWQGKEFHEHPKTIFNNSNWFEISFQIVGKFVTWETIKSGKCELCELPEVLLQHWINGTFFGHQVQVSPHPPLFYPSKSTIFRKCLWPTELFCNPFKMSSVTMKSEWCWKIYFQVGPGSLASPAVRPPRGNIPDWQPNDATTLTLSTFYIHSPFQLHLRQYSDMSLPFFFFFANLRAGMMGEWEAS